MKRNSIWLMLILSVVMVGGGCKRKGGETPKPLEFQPQLAMYLDIRQLRESKLLNSPGVKPMVDKAYSSIASAWKDKKGFGAFVKCMGTDPKALVMNLRGVGFYIEKLDLEVKDKVPELVMVLDTGLDGARLMKCVDKELIPILKQKHQKVKVTSGQGFLRVSDDKGTLLVTQKGRVVFATAGVAPKMVPGRGAMVSGSGWNILRSMAAAIHFDLGATQTFALVGRNVPLNVSRGAPMAGNPVVGALNSVKDVDIGAAIRVSDTLGITSIVDFRKEEVAQLIQGLARTSVSQMAEMMPMFKDLLHKIHVKRKGSVVISSADLTVQDISRIAGMMGVVLTSMTPPK